MWCLASRVLQRCRHSTFGPRAARSLHPGHGVRPTCRRRLMVAAGRRSGAFLKEMKQSGKTKQKDEVPTVTELRWESPLQIVKYPDPRLRAANANIGCFDDSLKQLAAEMMEIMYQDDGVGLAAPQVGVNVRLMVFNPAGDPEQGEEMVLVNPRILNRGRRRDRELEGCLSFPGINGDVSRPSTVLVKAQDVDGKPIRLNLADPWLARIFQHEYDHLEGVLFHDRMAPEVVESVRPRLVDLENMFLHEHPGAEIQRVA